ncbi:hypothetical protein [Flavobacterium psychrotrophum]|uniref:hypothetical protein n=1 Tax=Flavobacterium psychrotrophum TaxID=2294119 RepID=UPI000E30C28D|nr:hypothetical protein [Flavobacterium psychrotrophum]
MKTFYIRLFLLSFCLLIISCSTEDNIVSSTKITQTNGITARFISSDELDKIIADKLNAANQQANAAGKLAFSKKYNFNIDTDQTLMIEKGNYK